MTDAVVKRIVSEKDATGDLPLAKGVIVLNDGGDKGEEEEITVSVKSEIILAAGALQSPQILELSGIGGKGLLETHGNEVLVDNPGVGERLQDRAIVSQGFEVGAGVPSETCCGTPQPDDRGPAPDSAAMVMTPSAPQDFATILTCLNHPDSRGSAHIVSPDIRVKPRLDPKYMSHPLDLEIMARHVQFVEKIIVTEPLRC
ncbi:hypothetical protein PG993_013230 [Apiospora rasikravindrae]|uniref:Glucose-methanol-choline oxidoreductase N-terminal domain-containing protein n=1 Tax=Apiospora rasikravindrae TaxID=990691 RepID=A0ABR1RXK2_9PEZI